MTDFTKKELKELRNSNNLASQYHGMSPEREALHHKLNSMIKNYCEHKRLYSVNAGQCEDCGELIP